MAWRDILRHKGRSGLILALIALPIFGLSFAATAGQSLLATPAETALHSLGQTQGRLSSLQAINATTVQSVRGDLAFASRSGEPDEKFVAAAPGDVIPAGYRAIRFDATQVTSPVGQAQVKLQTTVTTVLDPAFAGKFSLVDGAAPTGVAQALGSPGLFTRFGLTPGQKLTTSAGTFEMVGKVRDAGTADSNSVLYLTPQQAPAALSSNGANSTVYLVGERPLTWADAKVFNTRGVQVTSRSLLLNPPSRAERPVQPNDMDSSSREQTVVSFVLMGALIGVLALLEVGLLAGAAFAVGARKQQRDLALIAASGAEVSMLRLIVTASGLWLGLAGGIVGAVLGSVAAAIVVLIVLGGGFAFFSGLHFQWLGVLVLVGVGLVAGWLAALVPARSVSKEASLSSLKSGRTAQASSKWAVRIGFGLIILAVLAMAAGCAIALVIRNDPYRPNWQNLYIGLIIAGAVLLVFALITLTGRIIDLLTARTAWLPVALRMAARDSARNRGRTVPAVAAVLAAATLSGALMVGAASSLQQASDYYGWQYNVNQTGLPLEYEDSGQAEAGAGKDAAAGPTLVTVDSAKVISALKTSLGADVVTHVLRGGLPSNRCPSGTLSEAGVYTEKPCVGWVLAEPPANRCELAKDGGPKDFSDWRCNGAMANTSFGTALPPIVVGGEPELAALLGHAPSDAAKTALKTGGIVLSNKIYAGDGGNATVISVDFRAVTSRSNGMYGGESVAGPAYLRPSYLPLSSKTLPAVVDSPAKPLHFYGVVSPETAKAMGMPVEERTLLVTLDGPLSPAAGDRVSASLAPFLGPFGSINVEKGPPAIINLVLWLIVLGGALITLSAAGITAGLALADGRSDHATLASVGADTRLRKSLSGAQTLMSALLGTVLGIVAGTIPVVVLLSLQRGFVIVIPWLQMGVLVVLVPLFGAAAAWVFTKGNLPMTKRETLA
ncbi:hypothetical protein [Arthrobacter cryoconiti]|uniref:FtsX-like permease family protein n=1 Tax=Arthrobacter cryoconiti TaxID=748907 RepID=A0ABV8QZH3_9MICC|nr:hypothetical protein [Arthrobacter cryoconiti]MCC9067720.1 hypothetical protein [Arthrobacter cryoconiti]